MLAAKTNTMAKHVMTRDVEPWTSPSFRRLPISRMTLSYWFLGRLDYLFPSIAK